jgi:hypothetical protein
VALLGGLGGCAVDEEQSDVMLEESEQAATQSDVWHATWNGGSANAQFWGPYASGYVDVFEGRSGSTRYAYLNFSTWSVDPTSEQCVTWTDWWGYPYTYCYYTRYSFGYGWGQIPAQDAQLTPGHARVKTTLGANFGGYSCTVDYANWIFQCGAPTGGEVDIRWNKNGQYSSFSSGTSQQTYGAYTYKQQGTYRSASANASGTLLGATFDVAYGSFGDTKGTNVTKSVMQTTAP